jgi:hypothetical protein
MNLTQKDFEGAFKISEMFNDHHFYAVKSSHDLCFFGVKRGGPALVFDAAAMKRGVDNLESLRKPGLRRKVVRVPLGVMSRVLPERQFQSIAVPYTKTLHRIAHAVGMPLY